MAWDGMGKWRSGRDSNPRYAFGVYSLSRRAPSTTRPPLRIALELRPLAARDHFRKTSVPAMMDKCHSLP